MTVEQVAAYLQLNRLTVYRYVREGKIPASRIGKVYRVRRADVDRFLEGLKEAPVRSAGRPAAARSIWVRDIKQPEEIHVGPVHRQRLKEWEKLILNREPLEAITRGLN
jgi:excisionase family DNA binding protein